MSAKIMSGFDSAGYRLATTAMRVGTPSALIETYPHPALIELCGADYRLPYKVSRLRRYWPRLGTAERRDQLRRTWFKIIEELARHFDSIPIAVPEASEIRRFKPFEDALDALVTAWVGVRYLDAAAVAYGDGTSAIWVPRA